ncbi:unnamed protein product, partial [Cylindrotheca closterium]
LGSPSVLDSKLEDFEKWAESIPDDGSEEGKRPFDRVGILKSNKTVTTLKDESLLDQALDFFKLFDYIAPTDGLYEVYERPDTDTDWFGCNMVDLFCPDSYFDNPPIPAAFEVNQSHRRPSVLFAPEAPIDFDIEIGPLLAKDDFQALAPGLPKDMLTINVPPTPRRNPRRKTRYSHGHRNGERTDNGPPPRTEQAHEPLPPTTTEYKNPSSAVKSRERD